MTETFRKLDDYQHARLRTEMYLGSREPHTQTVLFFDGEGLGMREFTWIPALYTGFRELVDNALDELIAHGKGDTIRIDYDPDEMTFSVEDNGRGIPIEEKPELGKGPAASILLGEARAGRNFDSRGNVAGVNGLGAAIVNFTSEWFQLDVWRSGKHFRQKWTEGTYRGKEVHKSSGPSITDGSKNRRGTRIMFKPSAKVYPSLTLPLEFIQGRVWDIAVANPDLKVYFNGDRLIPKRTKDIIQGTYFPERPVALIDVQTDGFHARYYVCPNFTEDQEIVHSVVNNIPVFQGGAHIDAFSKIFYPAVISALEKQAKKEKLTLRKDDVSTGLLIFNVTTMSNAQFDSQTKTRLISEVQGKVKEGFIESDVKSLIRRNPDWVEQVLQRCRERTNAKERREITKAQKNLQKQKVAGLKDATGRDRQKCVLFLAEGESAISGMTAVRDPALHGGIGLRGKIMNVHGESYKNIMKSQILTDIMTATGLKLGTEAHLRDLRYGSIYIATDEDEDGKNITALLVNFFYTLWPELFQNPKRPFLYKFCTPFIIATKGSTRKYVYSSDYEKFQSDIKSGKYAGWKITRAKGLGRLTQVDWRHSLDNPALIPIIDDGTMKDTLDLLFNSSRADDRKEWLAK